MCLEQGRRAPNAKHDKVCPGGGRVMEKAPFPPLGRPIGYKSDHAPSYPPFLLTFICMSCYYACIDICFNFPSATPANRNK